MAEDEWELLRQEAKRARIVDAACHPFGRHLPPPGDQLVFDDGTSAPTVLVVIPGGNDLLARMPAVRFFDLVDHPVRRIYIKSLSRSLVDEGGHPLGSSPAEVQASLRAMTIGHARVVLFGTSLGGFHALLHGALLGAATVIVSKPTTTLRPEIRARFGDNRSPEHYQLTSQNVLDTYGDIPTIWASAPPRRVIVHYNYRQRVYREHAEHLAPFPQVIMRPHHEDEVLDKIMANGTLKRTLDDELGTR